MSINLKQKILLEFSNKLEYHDSLNSDVWANEQKIKQDVRDKLITFAKTWAKFASIPEQYIDDILLTGGNCNYNYTKQSDLDVHILIDREQLAKDLSVTRDFIDDYLSDKKALWTFKHKIYVVALPVEPYAQDISERIPVNQGVYSLLNDQWVQKPVDLKLNFANDIILKRKVMYLDNIAKHLISSNASEDEIRKFKNSITSVRSVGIQKDGEFSQQNLIFKALRNRGILDKLDAYVTKLNDRRLSS